MSFNRRRDRGNVGHGSAGESHVKDSRVDRQEKELEQSHRDVTLNLPTAHP